MDYSPIQRYSKIMAAFWRNAALLCALVGTALSLPAASIGPSSVVTVTQSRNSIQTGDDLMDTIYSDCLNKGSVSCVKYKLFSFVDRVLSSKDTFTLSDGVTVVKSPPGVGSPVADGAPRAFTPEDAQSQDVETMVANRVEKFLQTHTLKIDLKGTDILNAISSAGRALGDVTDILGRSDDEDVETGRKKGE